MRLITHESLTWHVPRRASSQGAEGISFGNRAEFIILAKSALE